MYHLKLVKALSYAGIVTATAACPDVYIEDNETAEKVLATGYFETVSHGPETLTSEQDGDWKPLEEMNTSELETFATYKGVSLKGVKKKDDIIKRLREELPAEDLEGDIVYGSPTMVDLQES